MDTTVERDGHFRQPAATDSSKFMWICPSELAKKIEEDREKWLLLDTRSFSLYSGKHIDNARSFAFAPMLMKRLLKGTASLDSLILRLTDTSLLSTIGAAERIVLYDSNSTPSETKADLVKLVETLQARFENKLNIRLLLGGMETFQEAYPSLCNSSEPSKALSPTLTTLPTSSVDCTGYDTPEGTPVEILPFLYLGSAKDSSDLRILKRMNITAVLNITTSCPNHFEPYLEYKSIPVEDSHQADLLSRLQTAINFIDEIKTKGGRVFVHCHAGISRSATVCIAYLMQHKKVSMTEAYKYVQSRRPIISPNLGFMGQLMVHQKNLELHWTTLSSQMTCTTSTVTNSQVNCLSCQSPSQATKNTSFFEESLPTADTEQVCSFSESLIPAIKNFGATGVNSVPLRKGSVPAPSSRSRDGLRLSLNDEFTRRKSTTSANQVSPCRVEASQRSLTLSLNLSTTCT